MEGGNYTGKSCMVQPWWKNPLSDCIQKCSAYALSNLILFIFDLDDWVDWGYDLDIPGSVTKTDERETNRETAAKLQTCKKAKNSHNENNKMSCFNCLHQFVH